MVRVAFECVELDAVQLLKALSAALAREIVLHLGRVLLHVPVERRALSALVATDLAPAGNPAGGSGGGVRAGGAASGAGSDRWSGAGPRMGRRRLRWERSGNPAELGAEPARGSYLARVQAQTPSLLAPHSLQRRLACVRAPVYLQVVLPLEGLAAGFAGEFTYTWGRRGLSKPPPSKERAVGSLRYCRDPTVLKVSERRQTKPNIFWARMLTVTTKGS